jgi:tryptophanyl-tRNA synthetase
MRSIYGFGDQTNLAHLHAPLLQAGDILHPQLKLGPIPVVVPVGVDQDPHMRLCRDLSATTRLFNATMTSDGKVGVFVKVDENVRDLIARAEKVLERIGFLDLRSIPDYKAIYVDAASPGDVHVMDEALAELEHDMGYPGLLAPASTYHMFIRGLTGDKMSSSKPETAIFLDDDPSEASAKLRKALTGGRDTAEEQRRLGGDPQRCPVFETMLFHTVEDPAEISRIENECRSGARLCGQCKKEAVSHLETFLRELQERRSEREHLVNDIICPD